MRRVLHDRSLDQLAIMLDDGMDPLGVGGRNLDGAGERKALRTAAEAALEGGDDGLRDALLAWPSLLRMDAVTADLLHGLGIDPTAALVLADAIGNDHGLHLQSPDGRCEMQAASYHWQFDWEHASWSSNGTLRMPTMPDALRIACVGRRMHEVVDLPALARHELVITRAREEGGRTTLVTQRPVAELTAADLAAGRRTHEREDEGSKDDGST